MAKVMSWLVILILLSYAEFNNGFLRQSPIIWETSASSIVTRVSIKLLIEICDSYYSIGYGRSILLFSVRKSV